ncbi:sulfurtransferase complex subunit TusD [Endozoicomonas elysicola]|uniref:Sulfurtransferase n=1 Tax=Endozoicomonas elysicola TaxID=305900 RepID=A0A081KCK7_9GAMM|nr:sulfurtransferase complex subunit TusD [Endozoicomonas elysicola]KEI71883.1 sulfurtransferase [Endozoicomonas elysicola]
MKFALAVYGAPANSQAPQSALHFARAVVAQGHEIVRLFFYQDGVNTATAIAQPPQDESNLPSEWQAFIQENQLDAVVCIAAALRRGVVDQAEAGRYNLPGHNLRDCFELSGLGQLLDGALMADRFITFGA